MAKRHHSSHKKEHITKHDREIDRKNLEHARRNKSHQSGEQMRDMCGQHDKEERDYARYEKDREGNEYVRNSINQIEGREKYGYSGYKSSQKLMSRDAGMIKEDWNAACMLPTHVIEKQWPMPGEYMNKGIGSLFSGVQETMEEDGRAFEAENKPRQY